MTRTCFVTPSCRDTMFKMKLYARTGGTSGEGIEMKSVRCARERALERKHARTPCPCTAHLRRRVRRKGRRAFRLHHGAKHQQPGARDALEGLVGLVGTEGWLGWVDEVSTEQQPQTSTSSAAASLPSCLTHLPREGARHLRQPYGAARKPHFDRARATRGGQARQQTKNATLSR